MNQVQRGSRLKQLHAASGLFVMPNAWDAGSAAMLASLGFPAIATTSAGVAFSLGCPDTEAAVSRRTMLERVGSIAAAVALPVSADLQSGYGASDADVAQTIGAAIAAGVVGANIEDASGDPVRPLFPIERAVARVRAARRAADASGVPFVLTARTDVYLTGAEQPFAQAVERCNAYREAGADCLFVPGACEPQTITALVREIDGPITVVMGLAGSPLSVAQLGALGVRRVTIGGSLARATFGLIRRAAAEMAEFGTFTYAAQQIPDAELTRFFAAQREALAGADRAPAPGSDARAQRRCPLCDVVALGEGPETIVWRDDVCVAAPALHQRPGYPGSLLVFPVGHFENAYTLPDAICAHIAVVAKRLAVALKAAFDCDGTTLRQHNEAAGGQDVWHYHVHVVPRYADEPQSAPPAEVMPQAQRASLAARIRAVLAPSAAAPLDAGA